MHVGEKAATFSEAMISTKLGQLDDYHVAVQVLEWDNCVFVLSLKVVNAQPFVPQ
jgi:hypothetical protein